MKKILLIISLFVGSVFAESTTVKIQKEATGYGITKKAAITEALIQAIQQTQGVNIASVKSMKQLMKEYSVETNGDENFGASMASEVKNAVVAITKGTIDTYDIQSIDRSEDSNGWDATITVTIIKYKTPGHSAHKRRKLVVVPSYSNNINFQVLNRSKTSYEISQRLTQEIISSITQTRKFSVLDRANNRAFQSEKDIILSKDAHKDEILKLGNVLGTDYLVVSTISDFKVANNSSISSLTGQEISDLQAFATIQYKIIAMATKQIKWSNTTTIDFVPTGNSDEQVFQNVLNKIAKDITYEIIENIYPLKIAKISRNGSVIISQNLKEGTVYDVFNLGEKIYDDYTKEFLGYDEIQTGKIRITRSLPKVSYGQVIEGNIKKGDVCRISKLALNQNNSNVGATSSLPY